MRYDLRQTLRVTGCWLCCLLTGCQAPQSWSSGYEQGLSDSVKRQYWIQTRMQKVLYSPQSSHRSIEQEGDIK